MRSRRIGLWLTLGTPALLALALAGQAACPFAHDGYETDRPCWDQSDCVTKERCERGDAGILSAGQCSEPSDGPCGFLDGGTSAGFYCFPDEEGNPEKCRYEPNYRCTSCGLDGGLPDGGCPAESCLAWRDRWLCR